MTVSTTETIPRETAQGPAGPGPRPVKARDLVLEAARLQGRPGVRTLVPPRTPAAALEAPTTTSTGGPGPRASQGGGIHPLRIKTPDLPERR